MIDDAIAMFNTHFEEANVGGDLTADFAVDVNAMLADLGLPSECKISTDDAIALEGSAKAIVAEANLMTKLDALKKEVAKLEATMEGGKLRRKA